MMSLSICLAKGLAKQKRYKSIDFKFPFCEQLIKTRYNTCLFRYGLETVLILRNWNI